MVKKILVLTTTFPRWDGDTEPDFVYELSSRLADTFEIHVLAPHFQGAKKYEFFDGMHVHRYQYFLEKFQCLAYQGGILANLKSAKWTYLLVPFLLLFQLVHAIRLVRKYDIDLIHAHWIFPQGLIAVLVRYCSRRKINIVTTSHGSDLYALNGFSMNIIKKYVIKNSELFTVVSTAMAKYISTHLGISRFKPCVIPMGVALDNLPVLREITRNSHQYIFVGRLIQGKGVDVLLKAFSELKSRQLHFKLFIAGDGPERSQLVQLVEMLGLGDNIIFLGAIKKNDVFRWLLSSSCAIFPFTKQEGLGLVVVEAIACGCKVIVSDVESMDDIFENSYPYGIYQKVPKFNIDCLADAIELAGRVLIEQTEIEMCSKTILQKFLWENIAVQFKSGIAAIIHPSDTSG